MIEISIMVPWRTVNDSSITADDVPHGMPLYGIMSEIIKEKFQPIHFLQPYVARAGEDGGYIGALVENEAEALRLKLVFPEIEVIILS